MGEVRSGTGRTGAQARPLTRRQQKRARQRQTRQQMQQRQTQPPKRQRQTDAVEQPARDEKLAGEKLEASAGTTSAPEVSGLEPSSAARATRATRSSQHGQAAPSDAISAAIAAPPVAAESEPARPLPRRVKTSASARQQKASSEPRTLQIAASSGSGHKYPTLARMVAVKLRAEQDAGTAIQAPADASPAADADTEEAPDTLDMELAWDDEHHPELLETRPVPALASPPPTPSRRRVPTRRLTPADHAAHEEHARAPMGASAAGDSHPRAAFAFEARPLPLPEPDLVVPVAAVHTGVSAAAALVGAGLLMTAAEGALWPFTLAAITGAGGWAAYMVSGRSHRMAAGLLLLAQLGVLAWLLALVGARGTLLALVPMIMLLALRWLGRAVAYGVALFALALYTLAAMLHMTGALSSPIALTSSGYALLDGGVVAAGFLSILLLASQMRSSQVRAELAARARQQEMRTLRAQLTQIRQQVEDDTTQLDEALSQALAGRGAIGLVQTNGLLSPLAETTNAAVERLATLQRDREDRLRLEGAVRTVTQAVERAWLGLPWSWPEWSGTALDELVALLRAPRPQETRANWSTETPTLTAIPAAERGLTPLPWDRPTPISAPMSTVRAVWPQALSGNDHTPVPQTTSLTAKTRAPSALLPWDEWNTWREWALAQEE